MRKNIRILAFVIAAIMLIGMMPLSALAAVIDFDVTATDDDYYKLISKRDWELAPGIQESEIILNNEVGTLRQVTHVLEIDLNNPYTKVIPGYKEMVPTPGNYGIQSVSTHAAYAEANGYGNVVAATNCSLSWYNDAYYAANPHLVGEPLGYMILDGEMFVNSRGKTYGARCCIVINANERNGEPRPDDMPRVTIRSTEDPITGWEEQVIPVNFTFLVKDTNGDGIGENMYAGSKNHTSGFESRTFVGVKGDGTLMIVVSDGRQSPYSAGFNEYEMADYMIKLGCVVAANCDGGGSTELMSQRPGEDLKINCSLSDGGERPTTNSILVISTAPADGEFARATLSTDYDYYTPGSSVQLNAVGTDAVGNKTEIPADVTWALTDDSMGIIENGVFVSNGTLGSVTAQMLYGGNVVGEHTFEITVPTELAFVQPVITIPYGKSARIAIKATIENGLKEVALSGNDIIFDITNDALGHFDGLNFVAVDEASAPADISGTVTATLALNTEVKASVLLQLGKDSVVLEDFENGFDKWVAIVQRNLNEPHRDFVHDLSLATREDGQVHDGNYSLRLETNGLSSSAVHSEQYAYVRLGIPSEQIVIENARALGFWLWVPEDNIQCWVQGFYRYDTNGDGTYDTLAEVNMMASENVYYNVDESGWHYLTMDLSGQEKVLLGDQWNVDPANPTGPRGDFFIAIIFHKAINNSLWMNNGSINGPMTYYLDSFTIDYSDAVVDREAPVFDKIYLNEAGGSALEMKKREVVTTASNILNITANVAECIERVAATGEKTPLYNYTGINPKSAKAYVDGVEVECTYENGQIKISDLAVADGYHRVKFEICDMMGNKSVKIRLVKVESGVDASTIHVVPADATLDRLLGGSVFWMDMVATDIETIQQVNTVIDLNGVNHWELDHMVLAEGFTAEYTIDEENNSATITISRTGVNDQTGEAVLAKLPIRIVSFDADMKIPGYTAETFWKTYKLWPHDLKVDVDKGVITYVDGYDTDALNTFSNEEFQVDTEIYTNSANMDVAYRNEKGTAHVHTPHAMEDKEATCTEAGYTGRTWCDVCASVVDWGITLPAHGHDYMVYITSIVCRDCDETITGTGVINVDGDTFYLMDGKLARGWQSNAYGYFYFKSDYKAAKGDYTVNGVTYPFDEETGLMNTGAWVVDEKGSRYSFGPGFYVRSWREIDGKTYYFGTDNYMYTGIRFVKQSPNTDPEWFDFGEDGATDRNAHPADGLYEFNGDLYYCKDGITQLGFQYVDGDYYYFEGGIGFHRVGYALKNEGLYVTDTNGATWADGTPVLSGYYEFGADGKMIIMDGPQDNGYLYVNGAMMKAYGLYEHDGDYYYVSDGNKFVVNKKVYQSSSTLKALGLNLPSGYYEFDGEGKMIYEISEPKNGPQADGHFYIDDVKQTGYKLVEFNGSYYYIADFNKYLVNDTWYLSSSTLKALGLNLPSGNYEFDAEGKMIYVLVEPKNGPDSDGFFYIDDVRQTAYQLIEFNGSYYYIGDFNKYIINKTHYLSSSELQAAGLNLRSGNYEFDTEGKMIIPEPKNGPQADGFFYIDDVKQTAYQLIEFDGNYYYIGDFNKYITNKTYYLSSSMLRSVGLELRSGNYEFDAEGKMIVPEIKNGLVDGIYYVDNVAVPDAGLIFENGEYYYIGEDARPVANGSFFVEKVNDLCWLNGDPILKGYYYFDADGKLIQR